LSKLHFFNRSTSTLVSPTYRYGQPVFCIYFGGYSSAQCRKNVRNRCGSSRHRRRYRYSPNINRSPPSWRELVAGKLLFSGLYYLGMCTSFRIGNLITPDMLLC